MKRVEQEIEAFIASKAPGIEVSFQDNPAFNSTTIRLSLNIQLSKLVGQSANPEKLGATAITALAEVQKAAVTAIGLEEYMRERELAVLDRLKDRLMQPNPQTAFDEAVKDLGQTD